MTKDKILKILEKVIDPELRHNIVDLGLIYNIESDEKNKNAKILMTFTTPLCPYGETLVHDVKDILKKAGYSPEVEITFNPVWGIDKMSTKIKEEFLLPIDI